MFGILLVLSDLIYTMSQRYHRIGAHIFLDFKHKSGKNFQINFYIITKDALRVSNPMSN